MTDTESSPPVRVTVIGLGYVGLTTAVGLATLGHEVTGVDVDRDRVAAIDAGVVPIHEPGLQTALDKYGPAITFTTALDEALESKPEIVMIAVQTPGEFGTAFVEEAARETGRRLRVGYDGRPAEHGAARHHPPSGRDGRRRAWWRRARRLESGVPGRGEGVRSIHAAGPDRRRRGGRRDGGADAAPVRRDRRAARR